MGHILADWTTYNTKTKKQLIYYWNAAWIINVVDAGERWQLNCSLNYHIILQLESFCQRTGKLDEIPHIQAFVLLQNEANKEGTQLIAQKEGKDFIPLLDNKTQ